MTGVSCAALVAASALTSRANADDYLASNEADLRLAIDNANADGDPSATITLTNNISVANPTALPQFTKPVTVNTGAFTLSGADAAGSGNGGSLSFLGGSLLISGAVRGGNVVGTTSTGNGGIGLSLANGAVDNSGTVTGGAGGNNTGLNTAGGNGAIGMSLTSSTLVNRNAITGGAGGTVDVQNDTSGATIANPGDGAAGLVMSGGSLDNRGTITGGAGGSILNIPPGNPDNQFGGTGGLGASLTGGTHVNSGTLQGAQGGLGRNVPGSGHGASGGGLVLSGGSIVNNGVIIGANGRTGGGTDDTGGSAGGFGATLTNGTLESSGTIRGGHSGATTAGGTAIIGSNATVINSGEITAGRNQLGAGALGNAIQFTAGTNVLELRAGSAITGNVLAGGTNDTLALGGTVDSSFAVTQIGTAAQYRNFEAYQKVGTGTWTLTGTTTATTSWQLIGGTLSVASNTNLGAAAGSLTFNGGILQVTGTSFTSTARTINWGANGGGFDIANPANVFTVAQSLTGGGQLRKLGAGRLVLTGTNTYASTIIEAGTLQVGTGGTTGSISGNVLNNGTLDLNRSNPVTFGGVISGTGAVNQVGGNTTTLTGNNTYTGLTTISAGALQLGDGGTSGAVVGDILNNSILAFNRSDTFIVPGVISGTGAVNQIGTGTTVLTGDNTYIGGTTISAGTLQLGNSGASGSIVGDVTNNGALAFNRSDSMTFGGIISGTGNIRQIGSGLTNLTGDNSGFAGTTTVEVGTLAVNGSLCGGMNVLAGGRLQGAGTVCDTTNFAGGTIGPGNSIGTITVNGNYVGNGGLLEIETVLGGDASPTDRLVVTGDTSGSTNVRVINVGGAGAQTVEGIRIVDVGGASNGAFSLQGDFVIAGQQAVIAGAYAYTLQRNGVSTPNDGDWYLRSSLVPVPPDPPGPPDSPPPPGPLYQPGVPLYESYGQVLLGMNELPSLQQRVGNRHRGGDAMARMGAGDLADSKPWSGGWARIEGRRTGLNPTTTAGSTIDADRFKLEGGIDALSLESATGKLIFGIVGNYIENSADISSFFGNGTIRTTGGGIGGTATWYGDTGFYVDGQARANWYSSSLKSELVGPITSGNDGFGYAFGAESGQRFGLGNGWSLTPQVQGSYSNVTFDSFIDRFGAAVSLGHADSLLGRAGLSLDHQKTWRDASGQIMRSDVYGIANVHYEFLDGTNAIVAGTSFANSSDRLWGGIGAGGTFSWANDRYALYGEVSYNTSLENVGDSHSYKGTAGFRIRW